MRSNKWLLPLVVLLVVVSGIAFARGGGERPKPRPTPKPRSVTAYKYGDHYKEDFKDYWLGRHRVVYYRLTATLKIRSTIVNGRVTKREYVGWRSIRPSGDAYPPLDLEYSDTQKDHYPTWAYVTGIWNLRGAEVSLAGLTTRVYSGVRSLTLNFSIRSV